jgi:hypothetical protein
VKFRPPHEWIEVPDHHEPYVSRETWRRIQEMLAARRPRIRPLIGKGPGLLQGRLRCAACSRWMKTQYWGRDGVARTATYTCIRQNGWGEATHKVNLPARYVEHAVVEHVLAALATVDKDTARMVIAQSQQEHAALERAQRRQQLDADEDVEKLFRLLNNAPTEHQSARNDLWAKYNEAVQRQLELKTQRASKSPSLSITSGDVETLIRLTQNVRQLWNAPERTNDQRKQLLETVIEEILVHHADRDGADLEILWKGSLRERLRVYRPRGLEAAIADRTRSGKSNGAIADELNAAGAMTASGRPVSPQLVAQKQGRRGLRLKDERRRARMLICEGLIENLPRSEIRSRLQVESPRLGPWTAQRLSDYVRLLKRRGAADIGPLPTILPAEEDRQRALALTDQALGGPTTWKEIAVLLNEAGLRPPRGKAFTPVQVRLLYLRARGLTTFKLPGRSDHKRIGA